MISIPHPSYPFENATHWRMRAEKMRTLAEEANDPTVRAMMLRIAADYDRLAKSADDRAAHEFDHVSNGGNPARSPSREFTGRQSRGPRPSRLTH